MVRAQMNPDHSVNVVGTYRSVVNFCKGVTERAATGADLETLGRIGEIFNDMQAVFTAVEEAQNQMTEVQLKNPDLNADAIGRKKADIAGKAATDANAARDRAKATTDRLEAKLKAATMPKLPATKDLAAQQMQILNLKNDYKMLFDNIHEAALADAMLSELKNKVESSDELAIFLLGSSEWPQLYLRSRGQDISAFDYSTKAAQIIQPLISEDVAVQARILRQINAGGSDGIRAVLANIDSYLVQAIAELAAMAGLAGWSTDPMHRY